MKQLTPVELAESIRESLKNIDYELHEYKHDYFPVDTKKDSDGNILVDGGEVMSNIVLAMRHIEDARMRLGKVIQYSNGGESCYKK